MLVIVVFWYFYVFFLLKEFKVCNPYYFLEERKNATEEMTAPQEETTLQTILSNYEIWNISNADEFGLFYPVLPQKTLNRKEKSVLEVIIVKLILLGLLLQA